MAESKIKVVVNTPDYWNALLQELDHKIIVVQRRLEHEKDVHMMFKHQGELRALRDLKRLRDEVNGRSSS